MTNQNKALLFALLGILFAACIGLVPSRDGNGVIIILVVMIVLAAFMAGYYLRPKTAAKAKKKKRSK